MARLSRSQMTKQTWHRSERSSGAEVMSPPRTAGTAGMTAPGLPSAKADYQLYAQLSKASGSHGWWRRVW